MAALPTSPHSASMQYVATCRVCAVRFLTADGLGSRAAAQMRAHLRDAHPERPYPDEHRRIVEVLRWFDLSKAEVTDRAPEP